MIATILLIFAAVMLGTYAVFFAITALKSSAELKRRLSRLADGPAGAPPEIQTAGLLREPHSSKKMAALAPVMASLKKKIDFSGSNLTPLNFLTLVCAVSVAGFLLVYAWQQSFSAALLAAPVSGYLPFGYLRYQTRKRTALFAEQLPEALTMISRSLRAGHSLASSVELIGQELADPAGGLFKMAYEQQKFGMRMSESLAALLNKIDSVDFNFLVTIIRINSESGGNLSEVLDKLAETMRSRQQIRRQVEVFTAEGRISGYILVAMPVVVFAMFSVLSPGYMDVFFTQRICQMILAAAALGQVVGFLVIRKIVDIRI